MTEHEGEFKAKFLSFLYSKSSKVSNSFTITNAKRQRIIRCLKDPHSEPSSKFRFWVRQKKFRLIQSEDGEGDIVGVPADEKIGEEVCIDIENYFHIWQTAYIAWHKVEYPARTATAKRMLLSAIFDLNNSQMDIRTGKTFQNVYS